MPRFNGMGPEGKGSQTGRGLGNAMLLIKMWLSVPKIKTKMNLRIQEMVKEDKTEDEVNAKSLSLYTFNLV